MGSDCFYFSMALNRRSDETLPGGVTRVEEDGVALARFHRFWSKAASSLGASQPAARVVKMALERSGGFRSVTVQDEVSMQSAVQFAGK